MRLRAERCLGLPQDDAFVGQQGTEALLQVEHVAAVLHGLIDQIGARGGQVGLRGQQEEDGDDAQIVALLIGIDLDESNLLKTKERLSRFGPRVRLFSANFADSLSVCAKVKCASFPCAASNSRVVGM